MNQQALEVGVFSLNAGVFGGWARRVALLNTKPYI